MNTREYVLRMFDSGVSSEEIASALNIPVAAVTAILLRAGREVEEGRRIDDPALRQQIIAAYNTAWNVGDIARRYGITTREVWLILAEEGVPIRRVASEEELVLRRRDAEVIELYTKTRIPGRKIAKMCGIDFTTMYDILRRYGIPTRREKAREGMENF